MKDPRFRGLNLITYLDDASRCVTGARLLMEATSENAVVALRQAIGEFGTPATVLSDNGSCFVGRGGRKKPAGAWTPTLFENELLNLGIELINSRPYHLRPTASLSGSTGALKMRYTATRACPSTLNITARDGFIFRWTCATTRLRSRRFLPGRLQRRSGQMTCNGWRQTQMTSRHNFHILQ